MSTNDYNNPERSSTTIQSTPVNTSVTVNGSNGEARASTDQTVEEIDVALADQSDSWETDDEGDFYTESRNGRLSEDEDDENLLGSGLSRQLIECYPTATAEESSVVGVVCDICLNEYKTEDKLRIIPCLHRFHTKCIDKWLKKSTKCPMCRSDLRKAKWYSS